MLSSDTIGEVCKALAKAQAAMPNVVKNAQVSTGAYKFRYATLDAILDAVREPLAANGLAVVHAISHANGNLVLTARLLHESGEWLGSSVPLAAEKGGIQGLGSAITYLRRYTLAALLGIAADDDDDGVAADGKVARVTRDATPAPKKPQAVGTILAAIARESQPTALPKYKGRIDELAASGDLTKDEADDCRAAIASRLAHLTNVNAEPATA